jgi:protein tyrosine phosphatase (PTP) superfamily phosphohydrolase (DUF442 family)
MALNSSETDPANPSASPPRPGRKNGKLGWIVIVGLMLFGVYAVNHAGSWKDRFVPRKFRVIDPGSLYASGQINKGLIRQVLVDNKIQRIIALDADDPTDPDVAAEIAAARELNIERFVDPLSGDGTGDIHNYAEAVAQMVEAIKLGKPALVHCSSGAQRSNGATFYYRVLVEGRSANDAAAEMVRNGHDPSRNPVLIPYLNQHMAEMAQLLVEKGVIAAVPTPLPQIGNF